MLGTVEHISYDGERVLFVEIRLPSRDSLRGELKTIQTCERIGQGSFGTVYRAVCEGYPRLALKIATGKSTRLRQELDVLMKVCTKGKLLLPRFEFGAVNKACDLVVIGMELCVPSTLHDLLLATRLASEAEMLFLAYQVLQAVACVHEHRCIHRDVKLQNFVFDLDGNLKLIDFGLASSVWNPPPGDVVAGTVSFMAPEMAHNALHRDQRVSVGAAADVWSAGIVLFSIFTQRNPYPPSCAASEPFGERDHANANVSADEEEEAAGVSNGIPIENRRLLQRVASGSWQWPVGCSLSRELRDLVDCILVKSPEKRPSIASILSRPIWNSRRRVPPVAVTAFLGVQDDDYISRDEAHLMRAVEQRSANITASLMTSRANTPERNENDEPSVPDGAEEVRTSLRHVSREEVSVGGVPTHQIYDVRGGGAKKAPRPVREISQVIAEETAKSIRRGQSKPRRPRDGVSTSRVKSRSASVVKAPSPPLLETVEEKTAQSVRATPVSFPEGSTVPVVQVGHTRTASSTRVQRESRSASGGQPLVTVKESESGSKKSKASSTTLVNNGKQREAGREPSAKLPNDVRPVKTNVDLTEQFRALEATEAAARHFCSNALLLEHTWRLLGILLVIEEDQQRYNITWLADEQIKSVTHPHRFKEVTTVIKNYAIGFVCDICNDEFLPEGKRLHCFHCTCGRDLCPKCYTKYTEQCKCQICGKSHANSAALRAHCVNGACKSRVTRASVKNNNGNGARSGRAPKTSRLAEEYCPVPHLKRMKTSTTTAIAAGGAAKHSQIQTKKGQKKKEKEEEEVEQEEEEVEGDAKVGQKGGKPIKSSPATAPSLFSRPINMMPEGPWKPFEKLSVTQQAMRAVQPTAEERQALLHGDWIRHFHLFPASAEEGEPVAFTYHIQPGRTGAIFLSNTFPVHSAVMSVLERQMFIVDYVDTGEGEDTTRAVSLLHAKSSTELAAAFDVLQAVVAYDCNMVKQHRAPGTLSVYQPPRTAYRCHGDPFVYVRWFRFNEERSLSAFLLSNGAVQIFVGDEYELRWLDEDRKFLLRGNGVCEKIDDATFALSSAVNHLLYDTF